jgi:hypothetical protein
MRDITLNPASFVAGAAATLTALWLPSAVRATFDAWTLVSGTVSPGLGCAAVAAMAAAAAGWTWRAKSGGPEPRIDSVSELARRTLAMRPCVAATAGPGLPDLEDWLIGRAGVASAGDGPAIRLALAGQLAFRWEGVEIERCRRAHRVALLILFALRAEERHGSGDARGRYGAYRDGLAAAAKRTRERKASGGHPDRPAESESAADISGYVDAHWDILDVVSHERRWAEDIAARHAWSETVLMAALAAARECATLPETDFAWLMDIDRPLAMALNAVGRPSFLPESLGAACHFLAEIRAGHRLAEPHVEAGVRGIRRELGTFVPARSPDGSRDG